MKREDTKAKSFDILHFVADNAGLSTFDAIEKAYYMGVSEQKSCEDAISRRAVLNTLDKMDSVLDEDRTVKTYKELLVACYNDLPSVTPTRKKGKWIRVGHDKVKCSECEVVHFIAQYPNGAINYCPNCGTRMEGEDL